MHDAAIARPDLGCLNPRVLAKSRIDFDVLIRRLAARWHGKRFGHGDDAIDRAQLPAVGRLRREWGGTDWLAGWSAGVGPVQQRLTLGFAEARVVGEPAVARVSMPRRHAAIGDRFADRAGPALRIVRTLQGKGSNPAVAVASRAALIQDRGDIAVICHAPFGPHGDPPQRAAGWVSARHAHRSAGQ